MEHNRSMAVKRSCKIRNHWKGKSSHNRYCSPPRIHTLRKKAVPENNGNSNQKARRYMHLELQPAQGSELQNRDYCSKSGDYKEYGALTVTDQKEVDRKSHVVNVMKDWMTLSKDEFESKWPYEALHWRRKLMEWEAGQTMRSEVWDSELRQKNIWIWGPPGTGKSRWARSQAPNQCYCKLINK